MDENECVKYTDRMFGRISAESVADGGSGFYTVYGYTPRIYDNIQRNGDKINIQASFSYDENNDVTIISIGSPVLNCDY